MGKLVFAWLPLCGDNIKGDPLPPDCARFDVLTSSSGSPARPQICKGKAVPAISVEADPLTGVVKSTGVDNGGWQIEFSERRVAIDTGQLVVNVIDSLLATTTPWECIEEATDCAADGTCLIDCVALGKAVETVAEGSGPFVRATCRNAVRSAGRRAVEAFPDAFESDELVFSGRASIEPGADRLGREDFESMLQQDPAHRDGAWTGFLLSSDSQQLGAWRAKRAPK